MLIRMGCLISFPSSARLCASEGQQEALSRKTRSLMFLAVEWSNWAIKEMTTGQEYQHLESPSTYPLLSVLKKCCVDVMSAWTRNFLMYLRQTRPPWVAVALLSKEVMITEILSRALNHSVLWPRYCSLSTEPLILVARPQMFFPIFRQFGSRAEHKHICAYFPTAISVLVLSM